MLLVSFIVLTIIGIFLIWINNRFCPPDWVEPVSFLTTIIGSVCVAISVIWIVIASVTAPGEVDRNEQTYEALVYQAEHDMYSNITENGKQELVNQIREWNEDLAYYKRLQRDFWVGVYVPNVFDDFEFIPIEIISVD